MRECRPPPAPCGPRRAVAVDGKTLRGSGHHGHPQVHLLAMMDHTSHGVLAQTGVDSKTNCAVTSLTAAHTSPACLADYVGGHWGIEALQDQRTSARPCCGCSWRGRSRRDRPGFPRSR
jgi:hypothetical protein